MVGVGKITGLKINQGRLMCFLTFSNSFSKRQKAASYPLEIQPVNKPFEDGLEKKTLKASCEKTCYKNPIHHLVLSDRTHIFILEVQLRLESGALLCIRMKQDFDYDFGD